MAEMKHMVDSNENAEETLKPDAEAIPKNDIPVDIARHDSGKEELEAKEGVEEAQASNLGSGDYKVMTINMDGKQDRAVEAEENRDKIVALFRKTDPDVVFCQNLPWQFDTVLEQLNTCSRQWECEKTDKAGVLWDSNRFVGCKENFQSTDRRMTNIGDQLKLEGNGEVQDLLSRTSFVKLTERGPENPRSFIAVSYHGNKNKAERNMMFQALVHSTQCLCKEERNIPFLIGGDFNFDTTCTTIALPGIEFGEYTMTPRSQRQGNIPHKDNFCWESKAPLLLSMTDLKPDNLDADAVGSLLYHDPILGILKLYVEPIVPPSGEYKLPDIFSRLEVKAD